MERIHIAVDAAQKAALYALAEDVGAIGQRGPSVQVLMAELAEMYIADPEQVVKIYAAQSERLIGPLGTASPFLWPMQSLTLSRIRLTGYPALVAVAAL